MFEECICGCKACQPVATSVIKVDNTPVEGWIEAIGSSNIKRYRYEEDDKELHVIFSSGGQGVYHQVEQNDWMGLQASSSKGSFIANVIKTKYRYSKVIGVSK
jgi:hypothetical protein